jgi:catalase
MTDKPPRTTTDAGIPVVSDEFSLTVGPDGPILLQDQYLIEQMANFNRERTPEGQPDAKGSGAFGVFETTEDVNAHTRALCSSRVPRLRCSRGSRRWPARAGAPARGETPVASR